MPVKFDGCRGAYATDKGLLVNIPEIDTEDLWVPQEHIHPDSQQPSLKEGASAVENRVKCTVRVMMAHLLSLIGLQSGRVWHDKILG